MITQPSVRECDSRHSLLNWVLTLAATSAIAAFGVLYRKTDMIQSDVTTIKVAIQRLDDCNTKLSDSALQTSACTVTALKRK